MKPQLSIIIPVINEAAQLPYSLQALQALRKHCQIIVVDGGSMDNSVELATPLVDAVLLSPCGRAKQMNFGAAHALADTLLFLHIDTRLPDNALTLIQQSHAQWGRFDVAFDCSQLIFKLIAFMMNWRSRLTGIATGDQALFMSRAVFQAVGGFPDVALMEDIAITQRLKKHSKPCCLTQKVITSARRWQQHGIVKSILLMWWLRLRYFFWGNPNVLAAQYYRKS